MVVINLVIEKTSMDALLHFLGQRFPYLCLLQCWLPLYLSKYLNESQTFIIEFMIMLNIIS
jgi:hypothetical protein